MASDNGLVVSVVDDDPALRKSLRNLLTATGFRVEIFESPTVFLEADRWRPSDCVVLDLGMPEMSGLEVLSKLSSAGSRTPVIVFTGHGDEAERRQCLRAGAVAFLRKPCDIDVLSQTVLHAAMHGRSIHQPAANTDHCPWPASDAPRAHNHICALFQDAEEEQRVLSSFVNDGFAAGEKVVHVVDPRLRDGYVARLAAGGKDIAGMMDLGQFEVLPWDEVYLRGDRFEQHEVLRFVDDFRNSAVDGRRTRVMAHMEWALLDKPGVDDLVQYEARANYVVSQLDILAICAYDLSRFSASIIADVLRTHPAVIIGGVLQDNPRYVPPDQFLLEMQERRTVDTRCHTLL